MTDKTLLKNFVTSREYGEVTRLAEILVKKWETERIIGNTEFEYLKASFERDGRIEGVDRLLKEINKLARI